jgi:CheY-like chemotaxis protein
VDQPLSSVNVLVVDNNETIRSLLAEVLELHGATVTVAETAAAALVAVQTLRPDVLLSDLEMPDYDGYWLIGAVRALEPRWGGMTPAACLTGLVDPEIRAKLLRAGFQYHIPKPVTIDTLIGIVGILALKP